MQDNFLDLADVGRLFQGFLAVFTSAFIAFAVEWVQGAMGYNKTPEQRKASNLDMLVSIGASVVGVAIFFIFVKS